MTQSQPKRIARRGRIFPGLTIPPEELAQRKTEREAFHQRCRAIFEQVRPHSIYRSTLWLVYSHRT